MNIFELMDKLDSFSHDERAEWVKKFLPRLSPVTKQMLGDFERDWDSQKPYKDFVTEQNQCLQMCVQMECSDLGNAVRKLNDLGPLTMDMDCDEVAEAVDI